MGSALVVMGAFLPVGTDIIEIKRMRVEPSMHRQGLGAHMLSELEAHAVAKGYRMAKLDTTRQQVAAQALYIAAGYTIVGAGRVASFETVLFEKRLQ
jgi:ribosomal protein S18 acetylase RimI-like enzyme